MRRCIINVVRFFFVALIGSSVFAAVKPTGTSVPGEVLIKIRTWASSNDGAGLEHLVDADESQRVANTHSGAIYRMHSKSKNDDAVIAALDKNPNIEYVEPNYIVHAFVTPNDPQYPQLWGLKNVGQYVNGTGIPGADINAEAAWNVTTGSASIVVGIVDTGLDYTHSDLSSNIWSNPGGKGNALCAAGTHGFNAITNTCDPMDDHYHGTHVSGTIGAMGNNLQGVVGVNWVTSIMALKFLDSFGSGTTAGAIAAIDFAIQAKIDGVNVRVLSNSWGGIDFSKALLDEINKANENDILFIASAGNDAANNDTSPHYPSSFATPNMISVAATDNRDAMAYFSNYGSATVHLGAPGVSVFSTAPHNSYQYLSGTSMAAPHVAGVAALVLAHTPSLTTAQVKSAILDNVDPILALTGRTITGGRLNAAKAVGAVIGPDYTIAANPPTQTIAQSSSGIYTVSVIPSGGFNGSVNFSASNLPSGVTASFTPPSSTTTTQLTLNVAANASTGTSTVTVVGTSGLLAHLTTISLTIVATPPQQAACPSFAPRSNATYFVNSPTAIAVADFNRDGRADMAITSVDTNKVAILTANTIGTYSTTNSYSTGAAPLSVAATDFNGDGKPDLAVANSGSASVSILLGNGDGSFQPAVNYGAGTSPIFVAAGDFNGDGKADLAVANNGSSNIS